MPEPADKQPPETLARPVGEHIAAGRGVLADARLGSKAEAHLHGEGGPVDSLLSLLWHEETSVRRTAALALCGGDRDSAYAPAYGYFAGAFLRDLANRARQLPDLASARREAVAQSLCTLLGHSVGEIRAMSNMRYSFLGSALYLALLSTCRDATEAVRRLRITAAHPELCRLLWNLSRPDVARRLNGQDNEIMAQTAGRALAALPPDDIPEFWRALTHHSAAHRYVVAPVLAFIGDGRAVPHLIRALAGQPAAVAEPIIACLGRLGDVRALPALALALESDDWLVYRQAKTAIAAIERANADSAARTLLRPLATRLHEDPAHLLRPCLRVGAEPPEELLRLPTASRR